MPGEVTVTECPNCGGPIDPRQFVGNPDPTCPHCHFALPVSAPPPPPSFGMPQVSIDVGRAARTASRAGLIATLVILVVVGGIVAIVLTSVNSTVKHIGSGLTGSASTLTPDGAVVAVPAATGIYVLARTTASTGDILRRIDPVTKKVQWSGPSLGTVSGNEIKIVAGTTQVFTIVNSTVTALDAASGRQLWQGSISNDLASPCDSGCAIFANAHLVALSKDGVVQSLDAASGAQSWSKRLNSTPRWLEAAGNSVLVDDTAGTTGADRIVIIADAATGASHQIAPVCPADPEDPSFATHPDDDNEFFVSSDRRTLTALITGTGGCAATYRIADGSTVWETPRAEDPSPIPFTLSNNSAVQGPKDLFFTNDEGNTKTVYGLDVATGAIRQVFSAAKAELTLAGVIGSVLVVENAPTFDSNKPATVGIDTAAGQQKWSVATRVRQSQDSQTVEVTQAAPIIVSCNSDANTCTFEAVDATTGTIKGTSTVPAEPASVDEVIATVTPSSLLVAVGWQHDVGFDPATAAVQWKWPS